MNLRETNNVMKEQLTFTDYNPEYSQFFAEVNKQWIGEMYNLEPEDIRVLENPETEILKPGGHIILAFVGGKPVGTVALLKAEDNSYELAKMTVQRNARGRGIGEKLCSRAIEKAIGLGAKNLILFTNSRLTTAIRIYEKLGFRHVPLRGAAYERADVKMEIDLVAVTNRRQKHES